MRAFRAVPIALLGFLLGYLVLNKAWISYHSGIVSITLGKGIKWGTTYTFTQVEQPVTYYCALLGALCLAIFVLFGTARIVRNLLGFNPESRAATANSIVTMYERRNPSGLKPLWLGLALATLCFAVYVAAA